MHWSCKPHSGVVLTILSLNCSNGDKTCEYSSGLPLRDRRKAWLPGEQKPWTAPTTQIPMIISFQVDPFDALPNSMPFRSAELFHYCKCPSGV